MPRKLIRRRRQSRGKTKRRVTPPYIVATDVQVEGAVTRWTFSHPVTKDAASLVGLEVNAAGGGFANPTAITQFAANVLDCTYAGVEVTGNAWRIAAAPLCIFQRASVVYPQAGVLAA